jgi:DNA-binding transcriptional regulator YiaG
LGTDQQDIVRTRTARFVIMNITLHKRARTTPAIRREIQQSELSERKLAVKYGISRDTVRKWKRRDTVEDYSHTPHAFEHESHAFPRGGRH